MAGGKAGLTNPFLCLAVHPRLGQDGAQAGETPIPTSEPSLDPHSTVSWKGALQTFTSRPALCLQPWKPLSQFRKFLRAWFSLLQDMDFLCDSGIGLQAVPPLLPEPWGTKSPAPLPLQPSLCSKKHPSFFLSPPYSTSLHALISSLKMFLVSTVLFHPSPTSH